MPSASSTLSTAFRERVKDFTDQLAGLAEGDEGSCHRARVATRRLRELVPVLGLAPDASHDLSRDLRKTTKRLGVIRELDVLMLLVEEMRERRKYAAEAIGLLAAVFDRERAAASRRGRTRLTSGKLRRLTESLDEVVDRLDARDGTAARKGTIRSVRASQWALEARLVRRAGHLESAIEAAGAMYRPGRLHDVRIAVKKFRYALELSPASGAAGTVRDLVTLKASQNSLGRLHDLEALIGRARELQASSALPEVAAWRDLGTLVRDLENECRLLHARYMSSRRHLRNLCDRIRRRPAAVANQRAAS